MRVLVCGGRDYGQRNISRGTPEERELDRVRAQLQRATLDLVLTLIHQEVGIDVVIQGGAAGADELASNWARINRIPVEQFDADWVSLGPSAGPIRNKRMLDEGQPDLVVAFPGGKGTANMLKQARKAGVEVREVGEPVQA
jgi:hypothetical protein